MGCLALRAVPSSLSKSPSLQAVGRTAGWEIVDKQSGQSTHRAPLARTVGSERSPRKAALGADLETLAWQEGPWVRRRRTGRTLTQGLSASDQHRPCSTSVLHGFHGRANSESLNVFMLVRSVVLCLSTVFCFSSSSALKPI